jgi:hypothetical protein
VGKTFTLQKSEAKGKKLLGKPVLPKAVKNLNLWDKTLSNEARLKVVKALK